MSPVELSPRAFRDLKALPGGIGAKILRGLKSLEAMPWPGPPKIKKLRGKDSLFRLRVGDYRCLFEKLDAKIVVHRILARKDMERILGGIP